MNKKFWIQSVVIIVLLLSSTQAVFGNTAITGPLAPYGDDKSVNWYLEGSMETYRSNTGYDWSGGLIYRISDQFAFDTAMVFLKETDKYRYQNGAVQAFHDFFSFIPGIYINTGFTMGKPEVLALSVQHTFGDNTDKALVMHKFSFTGQEDPALVLGGGVIYYYYDLGHKYGISKSPLYFIQFQTDIFYTRLQYIRQIKFGQYNNNDTMTTLDRDGVLNVSIGIKF